MYLAGWLAGWLLARLRLQRGRQRAPEGAQRRRVLAAGCCCCCWTIATQLDSTRHGKTRLGSDEAKRAAGCSMRGEIKIKGEFVRLVVVVNFRRRRRRQRRRVASSSSPTAAASRQRQRPCLAPLAIKTPTASQAIGSGQANRRTGDFGAPIWAESARASPAEQRSAPGAAVADVVSASCRRWVDSLARSLARWQDDE